MGYLIGKSGFNGVGLALDGGSAENKYPEGPGAFFAVKPVIDEMETSLGPDLVTVGNRIEGKQRFNLAENPTKGSL